MIAEAFTYAIAVTFIVGLAAASIERLLAEIGRPRRFAWHGAYAVAVVFPLASLLTATEPPATHASLAIPANAAASSSIDWDALLLGLWAAATALLLLAYLAAWIRLTMLAKRWPAVASDQAPILLADDVGPAVLGIFRPRIVLPRWLAGGPDRLRNTVVAHELEHIAARDQVFIMAAQLVTILLPWNLPLWWFARRQRAAIEVDCDARVLRGGADPEHYAGVLLTVGERRSASPFLAATLIEPVTQLERRIRIMLTKRKPGAALRAATAAAFAVVLGACVARVEPPVVMPSEPLPDSAADIATQETPWLPFLSRMPKTDAAEASVASGSVGRIESTGPGPFRIVENADGTITVQGGQFVLHSADGAESQVTADRVVETAESLVLEGDVRFEFDDGTSVTTARAVVTKATDGRTTVTVDDAVMRRQPQ